MLEFLKKSQNNKNQRKYGALLSYFQMGLHVIIGLLYTPYMIRMLGKNEYGLYTTVSSTISMLTILNFGLNAGYIRYYSKYKTNNDNDSIDKLNGLYLVIFSIIGAIALFCGLSLSFNLDMIFSKGLTPEEYATAKILAILATINLAISFLASTFSTIISAHEKFIVLKSLAMIKTIFTPAIMLPILYYGFKSVAMVTVTLILSLFVDICYFLYCKKVLNVKYRLDGLNKCLLKSLFAYTFFIALNSVIDQLGWNTDRCVLARFKGTASVAIYSISFQIYSLFQQMCIAISGVFTPKIHSIVNQLKNDPNKLNNELTTLFIKIGRIQFLIEGLMISGFVFFGQDFLRFWVGNGYENSYFITILFMLGAAIPLMQNLGIEIQRALNKHQFRSIFYLFTQIGHLILSIILCHQYDALGCAVGNTISLLIGPGLIINIFYHKKCYLNIFAFWKNILRMSIGLFIPISLMLLVQNNIQFNTLPNFIIGIIVYTVVYCISMWFCSLNSYEKELVLKRKK